MAHHSMEPLPEDIMRKVFGGWESVDKEEVGATGRYPEGKLTDADEGEIRFMVGAGGGKIVIDFGKPVTWVGMSPAQALDLARLLMTKANSSL